MKEYKVEEYTRTVTSPRLEEYLNQFAQEGWQFRHSFHPVNHVIVVIFERNKTS